MLELPSSEDIDSCIAYYLVYCQTKGQSDTTVDGKAFNLSLFSRWTLVSGVKDAVKVGIDELDRYQAHLNSYRKVTDGKPLSRGTIRLRLTAVKMFLRTLYRKGVIEHNGFEKFELPKMGRRLPPAVLSPREVESVIHQAELTPEIGLRDSAILETYYAAGLRRFELQQLTVEDIDFNQHYLRVYRGKGLKDRYVPIAKATCIKIYRYLKEVRPLLANQHSGSHLFVTNCGKPYRRTQLSDLAAKYIKLANIRKCGACNQFRHAAATHMVDNGADIRHTQEFLGHADISTTQIYVHVSMAKLKDVYGRTHPAAKGHIDI